MEKRKAISIKLPPELLDRVDRIMAAGTVKTTRTAFIEAAIERLCNQMDPKGERHAGLKGNRK
jgi:metal-responsive CopG/Arc/MetJ family transcriptional regulator